MTIYNEQLPTRTLYNINLLYICGRGTIATETHGALTDRPDVLNLSINKRACYFQLAHSEAPPSASGAHYPWVNRTRILKSLYTGRKTYKTHSILAHIYHKSLAELWFTFAERDIPHKSVFNTWKLSKKWLLGQVSVRECFALGDLRPSIAGKGCSV